MSGQSGYFAVAERDGIFWLIDPTGRRFLSKGVNAVRFDQDRIQGSDRIPYAEACKRKYGNQNAWRAAAAGRLARWGFNTLGSWSDETVASAGPSPLAVAPNLDLGMSFAWGENEQTTVGYRLEFPDVFDQNFDRHIQRRAEELCGPRRDQQQVLGWFVDNELRWCRDWRGAEDCSASFSACRWQMRAGTARSIGSRSDIATLRFSTRAGRRQPAPGMVWRRLLTSTHRIGETRPTSAAPLMRRRPIVPIPGALGSPPIATTSPRTWRNAILR